MNLLKTYLFFSFLFLSSLLTVPFKQQRSSKLAYLLKNHKRRHAMEYFKIERKEIIENKRKKAEDNIDVLPSIF